MASACGKRTSGRGCPLWQPTGELVVSQYAPLAESTPPYIYTGELCTYMPPFSSSSTFLLSLTLSEWTGKNSAICDFFCCAVFVTSVGFPIAVMRCDARSLITCRSNNARVVTYGYAATREWCCEVLSSAAPTSGTRTWLSAVMELE